MNNTLKVIAFLYVYFFVDAAHAAEPAPANTDTAAGWIKSGSSPVLGTCFDIGFHDEHRAQNRDRPFARWNEPLGTSSGEPNHPSNKRPVGWGCLLQAIRDIQWQPVAALVERPSWRGGTNRSRHSYRRSCKAAS